MKSKFNKIIITIISVCMVTLFTFGVQFHTNAQTNDEIEYIEDGNLYVSDSYFKESSTTYNPHLASLSMVFANSTGPAGSPKSKTDQEWFLNQSSSLQSFLEKIHFTDFDCNNDYKSQTEFDTIGIGAAKKEISDFTVVAIALRSSGYYREWANNMWLGDGSQSDYMHEGWFNAANKTIDFLKSYVNTNVTTEKVKVWITGFSRGGATANLTAGILDNKIKNNDQLFNNASLSHDDLYAYTFEAPQGANVNSKNVENPKSNLYNNIFNIVNPNDIVPKVAMSQYGFTRFGIDKYITNRFYDPNNYGNNRITYRSLISNITTENLEPDTFEIYGLPIDFLIKGIKDLINNGSFSGLQKDTTKFGYDANITTALLLEELTSHLGNREDYVNKYQTPLKDLLLLIMDNNFTFDFSNIGECVPGALGAFIFGGIIYGITGNSSYLETAFKVFNEYIPNDVIQRGVKLVIPLLGPIVSTYWNRPNELISCAKYITNIFQNHSTEVTLAHVRAQDSYYIDDYNNKNEDKINLVNFLDNADYARICCNGFNDVILREVNTKLIVVEGYVIGKSDIRLCSGGFAVGYYSYSTEENVEIFAPRGQENGHFYNVTMKDYSKKLYHTFEYKAYYHYFSINSDGQVNKLLDNFKGWACLNSTDYSKNITII